MFNRIRSLLLNELPNNSFPYGEEAVPAEFVRRRSTDLLRLGTRALYGDNPDRAMKNWVLGALAPALHCRAADRFARRTDARVSYWPTTDRAIQPDWSRFGRVETSGPEGLVVLGQPSHTIRLLRRFTVSAVPLGAVTVKADDSTSVTTTPTYSGGLSTPVRLVGNLSALIPSSGGEWSVTAVGRPPVVPEDVLNALIVSGLLTFWFAKDPGLKTAFEASGHVPEKLGLALIALAELTDLSR